MTNVNNVSVRTYLLVGFVATAAMTLLAGITGVLSLNRIENAVLGSTEIVREHVDEQSVQLKYTLAVERLRDAIQGARTREDTDKVQYELGRLPVVDSEWIHPLKAAFGRLIDLKQQEIDLFRQLTELTETLDTDFKDLYAQVSILADNVTSGPMPLKDVSADDQTAWRRANAVLVLDVLVHQLGEAYKDALLASDPAVIDAAGSAVNQIYGHLSEVRASLPAHTVKGLEIPMSDIQQTYVHFLNARKSYLTVQRQQARETGNVTNYIKAFNNVALVNAEHLGGKINSILTKASHLAHKYSAVLLATVIAAFGIAVIVGVLVPRVFGTNVRQIIEGMKVISGGNLTRELQNNGQNEFGQMAQGFNGMVRNLRDILAKIQDAAGQITASGAKILSASEQQAAGTREQSAAVSQTTSAASELSKTSEQIGDNVKAVSKMAKHVLTGMQNIREAAHQTNDILTSLNDKSKQIGSITELIDDIADQTNLLAVNASIEAARAGEQGRGFTVVADQISKLADSTARSTKDITALIELIQNEMSNAIIAMEQSLAGVESEIGLAQEAADKAQEIAMSANQQISGSKQIADAMGNIDDTMKQIAASAQMSAASVKELTALADELKESIKGFKVSANDQS